MLAGGSLNSLILYDDDDNDDDDGNEDVGRWVPECCDTLGEVTVGFRGIKGVGNV
jgi:hypothetical protein